MPKIKNPLTIVNTGGQDEPTSPIVKLTAYDRTTGVITGEHLGTTAGTIYMLDRDTNTYISQPVTSWTDTSITLTTPLDLANLEGTTSIAAVMPNGMWSTKLLVYGDVPVSDYGKLYLRDIDTGTISTMSLTTSNAVSSLGNNGLNNSVTVQGATIWKCDVVGFQYGQNFTSTSTGSYMLKGMFNLNQPVVVPYSVSIIGTGFLDTCRNFNQPVKFERTTGTMSIGQSFLNVCCTFNQPLDLSRVVSIGSYFLQSCYSFNQPLDVSSVSGSFPDFLNSCYSFNQPLTITFGTSIGRSFLYQCRSFNQKLDISNVTSIGAAFLLGCSSFNQPLDVSKVTSFNEQFLQECTSFNQPLKLNANLTTLPNSFLYGCHAFNQPIDTSHITTIGNNALASSTSGCRGAFNQPLDLSNVTSVGGNFLNGHAFNQPLDLSKATSIGNSFLLYCSAFNSSITLSSTLTTLGQSFLSHCDTFNQPLDISHIQTIGTSFLRESMGFNQPLDLASAVSIGAYFLFQCTSFSYPITLPSTVTSIGGDRFLARCYSFSKLTINTTILPTDYSNYTLGDMGTNTRPYVEGIKLYGQGATAWKAALPDRTSTPTRKLIDMTA